MQLADYFVSGLWKQYDKVTNLMLHLNKDNVLQHGQKVSSTYVIDLIKKGSVIFALKWNYQTGQWAYVAPLEVKGAGHEENLYCKYSEAGVNLENLLNLNCLYSEPANIVPLVRKRKNNSIL